MKKSQKQLFTEQEGNNWLSRNNSLNYSPSKDRFLQVLKSAVGHQISSEYSILEIGCGAGNRLQNLVDTYGCNCYGLDPSSDAINEANGQHERLKVFQGTADNLPFTENKFDIVCFGNCLMWIDLSDLFTVASEAFRVAKPNSFIAYRDFYSRSYKKNSYHHDDRVLTTKMDFTTMFSWHPSISLVYHEVVGHKSGVFTTRDDDSTSHAFLRVTKELP